MTTVLMSFSGAEGSQRILFKVAVTVICIVGGLVWVLNRPSSLIEYVPLSNYDKAVERVAGKCSTVGSSSSRARDWQVDLPAWYSADGHHTTFPSSTSSWRGQPKAGVIDPSGSTGQNGEDQYAFNNFFYNTWGGSYLEMGALDGVTFSNTLWLHQSLVWRGLLIEGSPLSYASLVKNRPNDIKSHAALCEQRSRVHYIHPEGTQHPAVFGIYEFMSDKFKQKWYGAIKNATMTEITCLPLSELLMSFGVNHIDFFSLDVEGGELMVLKSIDFDCVTFNVLVVEEDGSNPEKDKAVQQLLFSKGYQYHGHVATNGWFVRKGWKPSAKGS